MVNSVSEIVEKATVILAVSKIAENWRIVPDGAIQSMKHRLGVTGRSTAAGYGISSFK